jgi:hypothetical protein
MHVSNEVRARAKEFQSIWPQIVDAVGYAFRMDEDERRWLADKPVARLIGAIPFVAGCANPQRTAVTHLGTYILSGRETKPFFNAVELDDDDVFARLRPIMTFRMGDQDLINAGMALLALNMIEDYRNDVQIDAAVGKYNPVASGAMDYDELHGTLSSLIAQDHWVLYSEVVGEDVGTLGYWYK